MSRTAVIAAAGFVGLSLAFLGVALADDPDQPEPPVRLQKKQKPKPPEKAPEKKPEQPRKDGEAGKEDQAKKPAANKPNQAEEERKELVRRVLKNMRDAEGRLAKNDPGRTTREIQRDILKDLDALIEQTKQQPPPQGGSSGQRRASRRSSQQNSSRQQAANRQGGRPQGGQPQGGKNTGPNAKSQLGSKTDDRLQPGKGGQTPGGGGTGGKKEENKLADTFKDIWGHYPEVQRQEMDAYARTKFIPQYDELLKQYYRTLSEQGRRKQGD